MSKRIYIGSNEIAGSDGKSAYQSWLDQGNTGTEAQFLASLKGADGKDGKDGAQGNTGSSVDYPYELVNNVTTNDATKGLSAAQGVVLDEKISQLGFEVLDDFSEVGVYKPNWIIGGVQISTSGWVYISSTSRVCMPEGQQLHLYPGDVIGLENYTNKTYYVGWRTLSGTYKTGGAWLTNDFAVTEEGYYVVTLRGNPETTVAAASDLGDLFFVNTARDIAQMANNADNIKALQLETASINGGTTNGAILPFEIGHVAISGTGWLFNTSKQRARIKDGSPLSCHAGDTFKLSDYTLYKMYVGWRIGTTYFYNNGWITSDFTCPANAEYEVLIARVSNERDLVNVEELSGQFSWIQEGEIARINTKIKPRSIRSVAHQGYKTTSASNYGANLAAGYIKAAEMGYDWGECDIVFSSDNVPFCCHQTYVGGTWVNAFRDPVTNTYVYFAENTAEQIKSHAYLDADHTVSTFEEVLAACKSVGLGLYIDKIDNITTDDQWAIAFSLVKSYAMIDKVVWLVTTFAQGQKVFSIYPNAEVSNIQPVVSAAINGANSLKTAQNKVSISVTYTAIPTETDIKNIYAQLNPGISICVYTVDTKADYLKYMPFVLAITSNEISEQMV